ncbi:MAG: hypothetical protein J5685_04230 [Clostridiales bacterium]|nr:hypothetical protein [Clostridiales bacterium]
MGLFGKLFGKEENNVPDQPSSGGTYIVDDTFRFNDPKDLVVVGKINGTVREGDSVYIEGDNEIYLNSILVKELNIFRTKVKSATDTTVALVLENGSEYGISKGTVLHVKV